MLALDHYDWTKTVDSFATDLDAIKAAFSPGGDPDGSGSLPGSEGGSEDDDAGGIVYKSEDFVGNGVLALPRRLVFTFSAGSGAWAPGAPLRLSGSNGGTPFEETIVPPANGGTVETVHGYDTVSTVVVPEQPGDGQIQIGVSDHVFDGGVELRALYGNGSGNAVLGYGSGRTDTLAMTAGRFEKIGAREILAETAVSLTLYF